MPPVNSLKIHTILLLCRSQLGIQVHSFVPIALSCCPAVQPNPLTKEWGQRNAGLNPEIIVCPCAFVIRNFFVQFQLRVLGLLKFGYWNFSDAWLLEFGIFQIV